MIPHATPLTLEENADVCGCAAPDAAPKNGNAAIDPELAQMIEVWDTLPPASARRSWRCSGRPSEPDGGLMHSWGPSSRPETEPTPVVKVHEVTVDLSRVARTKRVFERTLSASVA